MTRRRIAIGLFAAIVPLSVLAGSIRRCGYRREGLDDAHAIAVTRMSRGGRADCERRAMRWPDERNAQGPDAVFAYDASFRSRNPAAPAFDPDLRAELGANEPAAARWRVPVGDRHRVRLALRMPWTTGPCAILLVDAPSPEWVTDSGRELARSAVWSAAFAAAVAAVLLAVLRPAHRRELRKRDTALSNYVANSTHDMALPLTVLACHLDALEQDARAGRPADPERLGGALAQSQYLSSLLRNLGTLVRLEGDLPVERSSIALGDVVTRSIDRHRALAEQRGVELDHAVPAEPVHASADLTLVEQLVSNLIHNAIVHNARGGHAAVILSREQDEFWLQVIDDGPGIDPAELDRLTRPHQRGADAGARHPGGSGLGLAIARDVCARHDFDLGVTPREGGGLTVQVRGPVAATDPQGRRRMVSHAHIAPVHRPARRRL